MGKTIVPSSSSNSNEGTKILHPWITTILNLKIQEQWEDCHTMILGREWAKVYAYIVIKDMSPVTIAKTSNYLLSQVRKRCLKRRNQGNKKLFGRTVRWMKIKPSCKLGCLYMLWQGLMECNEFDGHQGNKRLRMLAESGSTNNFIFPYIVKYLRVGTHDCPPIRVTVATYTAMSCNQQVVWLSEKFQEKYLVPICMCY